MYMYINYNVDGLCILLRCNMHWRKQSFFIDLCDTWLDNKLLMLNKAVTRNNLAYIGGNLLPHMISSSKLIDEM